MIILAKYEYDEARAPILQFGDGTEGKILKRFGEKNEIFWVQPTRALMIFNDITQEDLIGGTFLEFKCPNPEDNLFPMSEDSAYGKTLCLLNIKGKETNVCRRLVDKALRERLKSQESTIESLTMQLKKQQMEMNMIINDFATWKKKQNRINDLQTSHKSDYDEGPNE